MTDYIIEDGVPIPPKGGGAGRPYGGLSDVIRQLQCGQSLWVPKGMKGVSSLACAICRRGFDAKFTIRTETRDGVKGTRIWRIA